jgi:hypothetical protein
LFVGGTIAGVQIWRNLKAPPTPVNQAQLKGLEGRTLQFPAVAPGATCPLTSITVGDSGLAIGEGPVSIISNDTPIVTGWGSWAAYKFAYAKRKEGLVLIRAKDLRTNRTIAFAQNPLGPSAIIATGSSVGSDQLAGQTETKSSEAVFDDLTHTASINQEGTVPPFTVMVGAQKSASGCVGLQFDGPDFTENLVIRLSGHGL